MSLSPRLLLLTLLAAQFSWSGAAFAGDCIDYQDFPHVVGWATLTGGETGVVVAGNHAYVTAWLDFPFSYLFVSATWTRLGSRVTLP